MSVPLKRRGVMKERSLKVVLVVAGLIFVAGAYPLVAFFSSEPAVAMIMSLYVPLGVFLLLAARDPAANRSLIAFAGWANVAHASVMAVQLYMRVIKPQEMAGVVVFGIIGVGLVVMSLGKQAREVVAVGNVRAKAPTP